MTTANLLLAAHLNIRAWDQSQWTVFFNVIWNLKKDERENFKNFSGTLVRPLGTPHKHQKGLKISESECWISLGKWSSFDSFSNTLGQHQIHLNPYWIALKSNRTLYVYSVYSSDPDLPYCKTKHKHSQLPFLWELNYYIRWGSSQETWHTFQYAPAKRERKFIQHVLIEQKEETKKQKKIKSNDKRL